MKVINKKEPLILALGDLVILAASLMLTLFLRYGQTLDAELANAHILPFALIFIYSIVTFYISGLYGRMIALARSSVPPTVIRAQIANGLIAVLLFYFVPVFYVTPKTNLFIYLVLSSSFLVLWRIISYPVLSLRKKDPALVIGTGEEVEELIKEMRLSPRIGLSPQKQLPPGHALGEFLGGLNGSVSEYRYIVADMSDPQVVAALPELYKKFFPKASIIDLHDLYEAVFSRIPLSRMNYAWIMSNISSVSPQLYDIGKRLIDIGMALIIGLVTLIIYPFVALAIWLDDKGPVFIRQERIGRNNKVFHIYKFRSMQKNESNVWLGESQNKVTRIGHFLRKSRIDELPQALAILQGHMSFVGPRTDIVGLGKRLSDEIPYYTIRTVITPGLTGWAQIHQEKPPQSVEETKKRLSYDLYYIKHRSLGLDIRIVLRTVKTFLSREGM